MLIIDRVTNDSLSVVIIYLWLLILLLLVVWLFVRRWRQLKEAGVWDTAVPQFPLLPLTRSGHNRIIATMLTSGLTLIVLGQTTLGFLPASAKWAVASLMGLGGMLFLWAGSRFQGEALRPDWLADRLHRLGYRFGVAGWQALLLALAPLLAWLAHLAAGDLALARRWDVSVVAWLLALGCCLVGAVPLAEWRHWLRRGFNLAQWEWWLLVAIFVGAWLLRGTAVTEFPNTFSGDEGSAGLHAALFLQGKADNWFTIGWFSFPSLYYALQSAFIDIFGQSIEALRYFAAFGGSLAVVAVYFLARVMFDRGTAVAASVIMMGSHYHIHLSRIGLNNVWDSLFTALVLAGLGYGWRSGRRLPFVLAGLALGLGQYFYVSTRVLPLLLLLWFVIIWWRRPAIWRQRLAHFVVCGGTAVVTFLPLGLYFARHWAEFQAPFNRVTIVGERLATMALAEGQYQTIIVLRQMGQAALGFTHLPLRLLYAPGVPLLMPLAGGLFLAGLAWLLLRLNARHGLLLLPLAAVVLLSGFSQDPPASQRFVLAMPSVAVLVALPVGLVGRWLRQMWPQGQVWIGLATAVLLCWLVMVDITFYFGSLYEQYVLGGQNTVVATKIAFDLQDESVPPDVYFFGFPRMGYYSLATIPYLVPEIEAVDLIEPITAPPVVNLARTTWFIFLPERLNELQFIQEAYPGGQYEEIQDASNMLLYSVYRVDR